MQTVFVVSDGTGGTAHHVVSAALKQFSDAAVDIEHRPGVRERGQLDQVVEEAAVARGLIVHTLVSDTLRGEMLRACRLHHVSQIDLMGPLLERLSRQLSITPLARPGLFHQLDEHYFRRIEAMEFAFKHDDGQRAHELDRAEIVLVGVSRTFKTPLSVYLAYQGWFAANVPIVLDAPLPGRLDDLPLGRVFALNTDAQRLAALRLSRQARLGMQAADYADPDAVRQELRYARQVFAAHPQWPVVEVTSKPIEEIASEILSIRREHVR